MQVFPRLIQLLFCFQSVCFGFIFGKTFLKSEFVRKSEKVSGFLARWLRRCGSWRTRRCSASTAPSSTRPRSRRWDEAHKTQRQSQSGRIFTPSTSFARGSFVSNLLSVKHQWQVNESQKENVENLPKKKNFSAKLRRSSMLGTKRILQPLQNNDLIPGQGCDRGFEGSEALLRPLPRLEQELGWVGKWSLL